MSTDNPYWQRGIIFDRTLKHWRRKFFSELDEADKQAELDWHVQSNQALLKQRREQHGDI